MRVVCIVGMHRSGTSAVARIINLLGVPLGNEDELLPPAPDNPAGFWEHRDLKRINDQILQAFGGTWHRPPALPQGWEQNENLEPFRRDAVDLIASLAEASETDVIGFKDPRMSLLLPFWDSVEPQLEVVRVIRDPLETARSLERRNGIHVAKAGSLWLTYVALAARDAPGSMIVDYRDVIADPVAVAERLATALDLTPSGSAYEAVRAFADPSLQHERADDAPLDPNAPEPLSLARLVYERMRREPDEPFLRSVLWQIANDANARAGVVRLSSQLELLSDTLGQREEDVDHLRDELRDEVRAREAAEKQITFLENRIARHEFDAERTGEELETARLRARHDTKRVDDLIRRLDQETARVAEAGESAHVQARRVKEAEREYASLLLAHERVTRDHRRLANRRVVRLALALAGLFRPLFRLVRTLKRRRRPGGESAAQGDASDSAKDEQDEATASAADRTETERLRAIERLEAAFPVTIIVPIFNALDELRRCVEAIGRNTGIPARLLLIDDASTDPGVKEYLESLTGDPGIQVLYNEKNLGFAGTVNRGFAASRGDVVVLNSDTRVPPRWLPRLALAAYSGSDVATATALSDNAGAFSAPVVGQPNPVPPDLTSDEVGRLVARTAERIYPETPTGNGFCMYIKRQVLEEVGDFDAEAFPRGYGEENDFCMRALRAGWRHVIDDATYVLHEREASFKAEKGQLVEAGRGIIDRRYPEYTGLVREFVNRADVQRVRANVQRALEGRSSEPTGPQTLFVIQGGRGGTPATNRDLVTSLPSHRPCLVLTSDTQTLELLRVSAGALELLNRVRLAEPIRFGLATHDEYRRFVADLLVEHDVELIHIRHLVKHPFDVPDLARRLHIPYIVSFHDHYLACPTVHLLDEQLRFCGGICTDGPGPCHIPMGWIADDAPPLKHRGVHDWRELVQPHLAHADVLVTTSTTTREVYQRSFPELSDVPFEIIEHGRDLQQNWVAAPPDPGGQLRVCLPGNLDLHKGASLIRQLHELDTDRRLDLHFLGEIPPTLEGVGTYHGTYRREQFADRLRQIRPAVVGLFSITAETYNHTLSESWAAGVPVVGSDIGALAERIRRHGGGWIIDPRDPGSVLATLIRIADDANDYVRVASEVSVNSVRTTREMAADYEHLYRTVEGRRRSIGSDDRPVVSMSLIVHGDVHGHHPGSVHVRTLRRVNHPAIRDHLVATEDVVDRVIRGRTRHPDVVLVQRTAVPPSRVEELVEVCSDRMIPLVLEIDDNLLEEESLPDDPTAQWSEGVESLRHLAKAASLVTVSTPPLADVVRGMGSEAVVVPNQLDERLWFGPPVARTTSDEAGPTSSEDALRLLYMGTRTHAADLRMLRPILPALEEAIGRPVRLEVIGGEPPGDDQDWYVRLAVPPGRANYPSFVPWLRSLAPRWDAAVAPLHDAPFNTFKSDLKFLEYSAMGLASVCSSTAAYESTVEQGTTGYLANDEGEWVAALAELATDPDHRSEVAGSARRFVLNERTLGQHADDYYQLICSLLAPNSRR